MSISSSLAFFTRMSSTLNLSFLSVLLKALSSIFLILISSLSKTGSKPRVHRNLPCYEAIASLPNRNECVLPLFLFFPKVSEYFSLQITLYTKPIFPRLILQVTSFSNCYEPLTGWSFQNFFIGLIY